MLLKEAERRGLPCLFKLRHTEKVKTLVSQMQRAGAAWEDTGQGWEVLEATLALERLEFGPPCGLVRERPAVAPAGEQGGRRRDHLQAGTARDRLSGKASWRLGLGEWQSW